MLRLIYYLWELKIIHNSDSSRFYRNVICAILKLTLKDDTTSFVSPSTYGPKILCSRTLSVAWFLNKKYLTLVNAKLKMHHLINYEISSVFMWSRKKRQIPFFLLVNMYSKLVHEMGSGTSMLPSIKEAKSI